MVQAGGTAMFDIINTKMPRFPRASTWLGNVAEFVMWAASWIGIPLGPLRLVPMFLYMRKVRVDYASMSLRDRVYIGAGAGLLQGMLEALKQLTSKESS